MSTWVVAVQLDAPFKTVVEAMLANDVSGVAVLDETGVVVGVISEADLISKEAFPAATVLEPEEPLEAAAEALAALGVAAEDAAAGAGGPGTFHARLYDALAALDPDTLDGRARVSES